MRGRADLVHHSFYGAVALRSGRWKLVEGLGSGGFTRPSQLSPPPGGDRWRLYDLWADPYESDDLSELRPEIVARLVERLEALVRADR